MIDLNITRRQGMAIYTHHPKGAKDCVFCKFWIGNAKMKFVNSIVGYAYEASARGKCTKRNGSATPACYSCPNYAPSQEAERLL